MSKVEQLVRNTAKFSMVVLLAAALLVIGTACGSSESGPASAGADVAAAGDGAGAAGGELEAAATQEIGATGGAVSTTDGSATLTVPAGALDSEQAIRIALVPQPDAPTPLVHLEPDGLQFQRPVTLEIAYETGQVSDPSALLVAWVKPDGAREYHLETEVDEESGTVRALLSHFSEYTAEERVDAGVNPCLIFRRHGLTTSVAPERLVLDGSEQRATLAVRFGSEGGEDLEEWLTTVFDAEWRAHLVFGDKHGEVSYAGRTVRLPHGVDLAMNQVSWDYESTVELGVGDEPLVETFQGQVVCSWGAAGEPIREYALVFVQELDLLPPTPCSLLRQEIGDGFRVSASPGWVKGDGEDETAVDVQLPLSEIQELVADYPGAELVAWQVEVRAANGSFEGGDGHRWVSTERADDLSLTYVAPQLEEGDAAFYDDITVEVLCDDDVRWDTPSTDTVVRVDPLKSPCEYFDEIAGGVTVAVNPERLKGDGQETAAVTYDALGDEVRAYIDELYRETGAPQVDWTVTLSAGEGEFPGDGAEIVQTGLGSCCSAEETYRGPDLHCAEEEVEDFVRVEVTCSDEYHSAEVEAVAPVTVEPDRGWRVDEKYASGVYYARAHGVETESDDGSFTLDITYEEQFEVEPLDRITCSGTLTGTRLGEPGDGARWKIGLDVSCVHRDSEMTLRVSGVDEAVGTEQTCGMDGARCVHVVEDGEIPFFGRACANDWGEAGLEYDNQVSEEGLRSAAASGEYAFVVVYSPDDDPSSCADDFEAYISDLMVSAFDVRSCEKRVDLPL